MTEKGVIHRKGDDVGGRKAIDNLPHHNFSALLAPCDYIKSLPSKGVRSRLIDALNEWLQVSPPKLVTIKSVVEMLHNSSLILDDIEDNSLLRRGKTATHKVFGSAQSINSATYFYVTAVQAINLLKDQAMMNILLKELESLFVGQSWDLYWKFHLKCPTEREYFAMVDCKTGAMFRLLVKLMQARNVHVSALDFDPLTRSMGRFFQVRDDYMNLQGTDYSKQKGFCEDLDEGKPSYLIVHYLEANPNSQDLILGLFRQRQMVCTSIPMAMESKLQILECLEKAGTLDATWELLRQFEVEAEEEIRVLESQTANANPMLRLVLKSLSVPPRGKANGVATYSTAVK